MNAFKPIIPEGQITNPGLPCEVTQVSLPKINLSEFSGNLQKGHHFLVRLLFFVDQKTNLSEVQKLQYLKSSLKEEILLVIQSMVITEANYKEAFAILKARYDNERLIEFRHLKAIFKKPSLTNDNPINLGKLMDIFNLT